MGIFDRAKEPLAEASARPAGDSARQGEDSRLAGSGPDEVGPGHQGANQPSDRPGDSDDVPAG